MFSPALRPIPRSAVRLWCGKKAYRLKRYVKWFTMRKQFATTRLKELLPYVVATHQTPLYRVLQHVDMHIQRNKVHNLKLAIAQLDGLIVNPRETLSYWRLIGNPTRRKGYVEGMILFYGQMKLGIGGGLCQLSNLIYWITLHTPLQVTERHRHSYDVFPDANRTQPFGSGATCAYNYLDLMIRNDTDDAYQLHLYVTDEMLVGEWRSVMPSRYQVHIYEREHRMYEQPWGGYVRENVIARKVINEAGECCKDEEVARNQALMMYAPLLEGCK
ncbi:VanW family protein [Paenibacillus sp. 481]|uniref:VanW family protein n=1 Tax=Paenibacillus sp. 481 TaxID=2835869 RepID=UPI001E626968|nr:VanW family protein [Paenibacillus sp. 481]UHA72798.1 VanW family protein [Paenibacillus sp. 481]